MLAVLIATGETEKLRPLTERVPSPMVPVVDKPVMDYVIELLARHGIKRIIVSLHHLANHVESYFGNGQRWGVSLEYVLQKDPWGTAGALKWAERLLTETFLVMPADAIVDVDLDALLTQHRARQSDVTIVLHPGPGTCNPLFLDDQDRIAAVDDLTAKGTPVYNTGVYVMEPSVLEHIPERTRYDLDQQLVPSLLKSEVLVHGFCLQGLWNSLRSFEDHQSLQRSCLNSAWGNPELPHTDQNATVRYPSIGGRQISSGIWVGAHSIIHPSAWLAPPVYIGSNCRIGRDVELGPGSVIGANVIVSDGATIQQSTVMENTRVGQYVNLDNRFVNRKMLINVATEQDTYVTDDFLLGEVQSSFIGTSLQQGVHALLALLILLVTLPLVLVIAFLLRLLNGRAFAGVRRIHSRRDAQSIELGGGIAAFDLLRFSTRRPDNTFAPFGQTLERWELHRLPELWSVVRGDLLLVGVKPLEPDTLNEITEPWQQKRFECSVGFTGLWYVQTGPSSSLDEILIADTYHVVTRTWRNELRLLFFTPSAWFKRCAVHKRQ